LDQKTCILTGGANGIGERTALLFESLGAEVVILDLDKKGEALERNCKSGRIKFRQVDLSSEDDISLFIKWYDSNFSKVDVLINNARTYERAGIVGTKVTDWSKSLAVNLTAPFLLSQFAARNMIRNHIHGKIINMSAVQALFPLSEAFSYSVVKGALLSMVKSMAVDLGQYGIQAIAVLPGPIYTKALPAQSPASEDEPPALLDAKAATLLGRFGRRIEVAKLLAFLSSDDNSFITGSHILIDGGRIISRKPDPDEVTQSG
jgi:glucose 1-dehydrogenase